MILIHLSASGSVCEVYILNHSEASDLVVLLDQVLLGDSDQKQPQQENSEADLSGFRVVVYQKSSEGGSGRSQFEKVLLECA